MGIKSEQSWFTCSDGLKLYERTWLPDIEPLAHIVLLHGYSDRADLYDPWCTALVSTHPIRVTAYDRRGWGRTVVDKSQRGLTGSNSQVLSDLDEYIGHIARSIPDLRLTPLFLMGHSMGGQEALYYSLNTAKALTKSRHLLSGLILDAPYVALCNPPSKYLVMMLRIIAVFTPHRQRYQASNPNDISRDPAVCQAWAVDDLCHDTGTLQGLSDTLVRESELLALADQYKAAPTNLTTKLPFPVCWAHGTADLAVSFSMSQQLFNRLKACDEEENSKVFLKYDGWYHGLHTEPDGMKELFANDVGRWTVEIAARISR